MNNLILGNCLDFAKVLSKKIYNPNTIVVAMIRGDEELGALHAMVRAKKSKSFLYGDAGGKWLDIEDAKKWVSKLNSDIGNPETSHEEIYFEEYDATDVLHSKSFSKTSRLAKEQSIPLAEKMTKELA